MKVGFLGPEGTFSEEAGKIYAGKIEGKVSLIPFSTIHDLLISIDRGRLAEGICPLENSIEGTVGLVTDMLARDVDLKIKQEIIIPIYHYLIAPKGVSLSQITDVMSHPQALDQCKDFLRKKLPRVKLHLSYSTAEAVKQVASSVCEKIASYEKIKGRIFSAIGNIASARLYKLNVLASKINAAENLTRFIVLAKADHRPVGKDKTSIVFSIKKNTAGGLHNVLGEFAKRKINLSKIESRPSKKALGDYYFFVDLDGHAKSPLIASALAAVKKKVGFFKNLGSYPSGGKHHAGR